MYYVNISSFNFNWISFGLNVSGLGDFKESADKLNSYIEEVFTEAFSRKVNVTILQDMIDDVVLLKDIIPEGILLEFNNRVFLIPK